MSLIGVGLPGSADNTHAVTSVLKCRVALEERSVDRIACH